MNIFQLRNVDVYWRHCECDEPFPRDDDRVVSDEQCAACQHVMTSSDDSSLSRRSQRCDDGGDFCDGGDGGHASCPHILEW